MHFPTENFGGAAFHVNCRGKLLDLSTPKIMGILNVTPDSFSDGGRFVLQKNALLHIEKLISEGASIIDIGAQSTRPTAEFLSAQTEIKRLGNIISCIKKEFPEVFLSVDTFYAEVVRFSYNEGVDLINDISGGDFDKEMLETVAETGLPYILMHNNGSYFSLHSPMIEGDITTEINRYFSKKIEQMQLLGATDIILDPGFGFGKSLAQQEQMLNEAEFFGFGRKPLLIGISRKSFIYKPLGKSPTDINEETQKLHFKLLRKGANILRVHDVAETQKTIRQFLQG